MKVAVIALGKIGLPLAVQFARSGADVVGVDISPPVVAAVNAGIAPFPGESYLDEYLGEVVAAGRLRATSDTASVVAASEVIVVVVPLVVDALFQPDFSAIDAATAEVGRGLRSDQLLIYETTVPVGTTRGRFGPALEAVSGLRAGTDFGLAYSPERVSSGRVFRDLRTYPKLVGGINEASGKAATSFYEKMLEFDVRTDLARPNGVWDLGVLEAAEFTKLAETTYRDVNIALANEFAEYAERLDLDVSSIIEAANSQPFSHIHRPGIAVGGHCIPIYPRFYLTGHSEALLPAAARSINEAQPERITGRLEAHAGPLTGKRIAVLGAAYRGGVKETAFSGVFPTVEAVERRGGVAAVHDPMFSDSELEDLGLKAYHLGEVCDLAIVQANHAEYGSLKAADLPGCRVVADGRGVVPVDALRAAGIDVLVVGAS